VFAIVQSSQTISYGELVELLVFLAESFVDGSQFFSALTQSRHHVVEDLSKVPHLIATENGQIHLEIARGHLGSTPGETVQGADQGEAEEIGPEANEEQQANYQH
jgi:hypothetical protein